MHPRSINGRKRMACCISVIRGPQTELSSLRYELRPRIRLTTIRLRIRTRSATRQHEPTQCGRSSTRREKKGKKSVARRRSEIYATHRLHMIRIFIIPGPRISLSHTPADICVISRSLPGDSFMRSRNSNLRGPGRTVSIQAGNTHALSKAGTCRWLRRNPVLISMRRSISRRSGCFASLAGVTGWSAPGYQSGFLVPRQ